MYVQLESRVRSISITTDLTLPAPACCRSRGGIQAPAFSSSAPAEQFVYRYNACRIRRRIYDNGTEIKKQAHAALSAKQSLYVDLLYD